MMDSPTAPEGFTAAPRTVFGGGFVPANPEKATSEWDDPGRPNKSFAAMKARAARATERLGPARVCGAQTKNGGECGMLPADGHDRCRHHGGA